MLDAQDHLVAQIGAVHAAARKTWEVQHGHGGGTAAAPDPTALETHLATAVRLCASMEPAAHAALQKIYPNWLAPDHDAVTAQLRPDAVEALFEIENRLARALS